MRTPTPQAFMVILAATSGAALTALFGFGPLDPPEGPISSTYRTLGEVEPRIPIESLSGDLHSLHVINEPGSYYLSGNLLVPDGKRGILITGMASRATIDLRGFDIREEFDDALQGIRLDYPTRQLTICNGTMHGFTIAIDCFQGGNVVVRNMYVENSDGVGIKAGHDARVIDCSALSCGTDGIVASSGSVVSGCTSRGNDRAGIRVNDDATVERCTTEGNHAEGIVVGQSCTLASCTAAENEGVGITAKDSCVVRASVVRDNGGTGIVTGDDAVVTDCVSSGNGLQGFAVGAGSSVSACTARGNQAVGIISSEGCSVTHCIASVNALGGVAFGSDCTITNNLARDDGKGTGFSTAGDRSRIESNHAAGCAIGFSLVGARNLLVKNQATNTAEAFVGHGDDRYGHIEADAMGEVTDNPWANFIDGD